MHATHGRGVSARGLAIGLLLASPVAAHDKPLHDAGAAARGEATFRTYCSSCHGLGAEGDGPIASRFRIAPPDLTRLTRSRPFSFDAVSRIIDGRRPLKGHGGPEMPVWGDAFLEASDKYDAARVKEKITGLTHYLASLQKPVSGPQRAPVVCTFSNPAIVGQCHETVSVAKGASPRRRCEEVLACLTDVRCLDTYCEATTIRQGWRLDSVSDKK